MDRSSGAGSPRDPGARIPAAGLLAVAVVILAGALRLWSLNRAPSNPFYDAAVRSMGLSWHNFIFGAIDPGAAVSIDKPPADLWLQVASIKLLGFNRFALHLPEALGGSIAVALLYAAIRAVWGRTAGLLAALSLAVLPLSVLTSRSDTMDSVMAALLIASLWASVRALQTRRATWVLAAAALVGVAFNVKLSEALIPLPGLVVLWWMAPAPRLRIAVLAGAAATLALVGMVWIVGASLTPIGHRPYPIGSKTGSIYRVVFVYNGLDRLRGAPQLGPTDPTTPGPLRLLGPRADYNQLIGTELIAALTLALGLGLLAARRRAPDEGSPPEAPTAIPPSVAPDASDPTGVAGAEHRRVARSTAVGLGLWLLVALVLFSVMGHLQTRYLEAGTPAVAAALGVSAAGLLARARQRDDARIVLAAALALAGLYALTAATDSLGRAAGGLDLALALALLAGAVGRRRTWTRSTSLSVLTGLALLAAPVRFSLDLIDRHSGNAPQVGSGAQYGPYLHAHRGGAPYEVASSDPLGVVGLIAADDQPVLILNDVKGPLVRLATLKQIVGRGAVRYVLLAHPCTSGFRCPSTTSWSVRHTTRIRGYLYRFTTAGDPARTAAAV